MDLQSAFYIIAIICMLLWIVVLILLSIILWTIKDFVNKAPQRLEHKIDTTLAEIVENSKSGILGTVGITAATFVLNKLRERFWKK